MQLTAALFREIVQPLETGGLPVARAEQRRGPRARAEVHATILPFSDAFSLRALEVPVRDVSRGGFGFLHVRPVPLGESFGLVLPENEGPPAVILCTVAFWQPLSKDLYAVGAKFTSILGNSTAELPLLVDPSPPEARQAS